MTTTLTSAEVVQLLTGRTPRNMNWAVDHFLKEAGMALSVEQWTVMAELWRNDGVTQQEIADATDRHRAGTTRLLDALEKDGYLERRSHATDRRINLVHLTRKGKAAERVVAAAVQRAVQAATLGVTKQQANVLRQVFDRIDRNIQQLRDGK